MRLTRRRFLEGAAAASLLPSLTANAQSGTARIYVGFAAGGTLDIIARRIADKLRGLYTETIIVEGRIGAGGRLALEAVKTAALPVMFRAPVPMLSRIFPALITLTTSSAVTSSTRTSPVVVSRYTHPSGTLFSIVPVVMPAVVIAISPLEVVTVPKLVKSSATIKP